MISFNLKTITLTKPVRMGMGGNVSVYRPDRSNTYLPNSIRTKTISRAYLQKSMGIVNRRRDVRITSTRVFEHSDVKRWEYQTEGKLYTLMKENWHLIGKIKEVQGMAKVRKTQITWDAVDSPDVAGYRLYWAVGGGVDYNSEFFEAGNVTRVILPDDVPSFPLVAGDIEIGVTAVNHRGNESDMSVFAAPFDFTAPRSPANIMVKDL
jgi:hypothetical protein